MYLFLPNVKEHATPLAGAGVETEVEVHTTGDVADSAASGGCCVSTCSPSYSSGDARSFIRAIIDICSATGSSETGLAVEP